MAGGAHRGQARSLKRDLLCLRSLSAGEVEAILERALRMKRGEPTGAPLRGRAVGLLFEAPSTRTRVSFEVAARQLGAHPLYMRPEELQLARGETLADTARTLSGYLDALVVRTLSQERLEELARHASIPVINGLTDRYHPCQILADLLTIAELRGGWRGVRVAYLGDGNNVANSWIEAARLLPIELRLACPPGHEPLRALLDGAPGVLLTHDPEEAVRGAEVVYTDVWQGMGRGPVDPARFAPFQVNSRLLALAHPRAVVMHCLPARRGQEIAAEVLEGPRCVAFQQAENRLHAQKALLEYLLG